MLFPIYSGYAVFRFARSNSHVSWPIGGLWNLSTGKLEFCLFYNVYKKITAVPDTYILFNESIACVSRSHSHAYKMKSRDSQLSLLAILLIIFCHILKKTARNKNICNTQILILHLFFLKISIAVFCKIYMYLLTFGGRPNFTSRNHSRPFWANGARCHLKSAILDYGL